MQKMSLYAFKPNDSREKTMDNKNLVTGGIARFIVLESVLCLGWRNGLDVFLVSVVHLKVKKQ